MFSYSSVPLCVFSIPLQYVFPPLHVPLAWHLLKSDPSSTKPSSQEKSTPFGKVVADPCNVPFCGTANSPQLIAKNKKVNSYPTPYQLAPHVSLARFSSSIFHFHKTHP